MRPLYLVINLQLKAEMKPLESNHHLEVVAIRSSLERSEFSTLSCVHKFLCNCHCLICIEHSRCVHVSIGVHRAQLISIVINPYMNI